MEIELGPFPKYENVRYNAYWAKAGIDTRLRPDDTDFDNYKAHIQDCEKHPTSGFLVRHKYITGKPNNYPAHAMRNKHYIDSQPEVKVLKEGLKARLQFLYPRTNHIRKYIINNERVLLDSIEPIKKYSPLEKIGLIVRRFI